MKTVEHWVVTTPVGVTIHSMPLDKWGTPDYVQERGLVDSIRRGCKMANLVSKTVGEPVHVTVSMRCVLEVEPEDLPDIPDEANEGANEEAS